LDSPSDFGAGFSDELLSLSSNEQSLGEFIRDDEAVPSSAPKQTADPLPQYRLGGILFQCYVFVELEDRAILIDKHAAHERILFENLKANMEKTSPAFQLQLIPIPLSLSPTEAAAALEYRDELRAIGFEFAQTDREGCPELTQIPSELDRTNAVDVFTTLVGHLAAGTSTAALSRKALYEKALFQASCKAAVKAGKEDDPEHIRWIVEQTLSRPDIRFCPHGRPVALELTKSQVEHMFHRP
jgi:DNA mismatch repair protein MutL